MFFCNFLQLFPQTKQIWRPHISASTAFHALELGFRTVLIDDCSRGINDENIANAYDKIRQEFGLVVQSGEVSTFLITGIIRSSRHRDSRSWEGVIEIIVCPAPRWKVWCKAMIEDQSWVWCWPGSVGRWSDIPRRTRTARWTVKRKTTTKYSIVYLSIVLK